MSDEPQWSHEIDLSLIPQDGKTFELVPDEATRRYLADVADVVSIPALKVRFDVRGGPDAAQVKGTIEGVVRQHCVVSLEEFENPVSETFSVDFAARPESGAETEDQEEIEELPDPIVGGKIDLGALGTEFLILSVDPYPRKPGVAFAVPAAAEEAPEPKRSPFEMLSSLKDKVKKQ